MRISRIEVTKYVKPAKLRFRPNRIKFTFKLIDNLIRVLIT